MEKIRKIILKVGSSSLVDNNGKIKEETFDNIIGTVSGLMKKGLEVVLVTSGAIAVGMSKLNLQKKPDKMGLKQACAALGQCTLMNEYEKYSEKYGILCAQILVNHDDFENRNRMINLTNTFEELFSHKILPIVNENDALNVDEIKVGDNDTLSSLLAPMINANLLVLASDIDGLYDKNPKQYPDAKKIDIVTKIDKTIDLMIGDITSNVGTGGMETKIKAARIATKAGCNMVIISATDIVKLPEIINGEKIGTMFISENKTLKNKEHWIVYNAYAKGTIVVDDGAKQALMERKSLLPKGIKDVIGEFEKGSVVFISDEQGVKFAKGICIFSSEETKKISGKSSTEAKQILKSTKGEVIHANSLVIIDEAEYGRIK